MRLLRLAPLLALLTFSVAARGNDVERSFALEDWDRAIPLLRAVVAEHPEDGIAAYRLWYALGESDAPAPEVEAAREEALGRLASASDGADPERAAYLAGVLDDAGEVDRADAVRTATWNRHAQGTGPLPFRAAYRLARIAEDLDLPDADLATAWIAAVAAEDGAWLDSPLRTRMPPWAGGAAVRAGRTDDLLALLAEQASARPDSIPIRAMRLEALRRAKREAAARAEAEAIAARLGGASDPVDLNVGGEAVRRFGLTEPAIAALRRCTEIAPTLAACWRDLGDAYEDADRLDEAVEAVKRAIGRSTRDDEARVALGRLLARLSRFDEAEASFRKAVDLAGGDVWVRRQLADFLEDRNRPADALAVLDAPGLRGEEEVDDVAMRVRLLSALRRLDDAVTLGETSRGAFPRSALLLRALGRAYEYRNGADDLNRAAAVLDEAVRAAPESPYAAGDRVRVLRLAHRTEEALALVDATLERHPDYVYGWYQKVSIAREGPGGARAGAEVAEAGLAKVPDSPTLLRELGMARSDLGEREAAIAAFVRWTESEPEDESAWLALAVEYGLANRHSESLDAADRGLAAAPGDARLLFRRGVALDSLGRAADALVAFDASLAADPTSASVHHSRAYVLWALGRRDEALAAWDRALELRPDFALALRIRGDRLDQIGRWSDAEKDYRRALELNPKDAIAARGIGRALARQGRFDEALTAYRRAAGLGEAGPTLATAGDLFVELGAIAAAEAAYGECMAIPETLEPCERALAAFYSNRGRPVDALRVLERRRQSPRDDAWTAQTMAIVFRDLGELDRARAEAMRSIQAKGDVALTHAVLGEIEERAGRSAEALTSFERAAELEPGKTSRWIPVARVRRKLGDAPGAVDAARRACEGEPGAAARRELAEALDAAGRDAEAREAWDLAVSAGKDDAGLVRRAASFYERTGDAARAVDVLVASAETHPSDAQTLKQLGLLAARTGRDDRAVAALEQALDLSPGDAEAEAALEGMTARSEAARRLLAALHPKPLALEPTSLEEASALIPSGDPMETGRDFIHLLDFGQLELGDDGRITETNHQALRVLTPEGVDGLGEVRIPYDPERQRLEVHLARTHLPDGTIADAGPEAYHLLSPSDADTSNLYSSQKIRVISLPAVTVGAVLEWKYTIVERKPLFERSWWRRWQFGSKTPTALSRFALRVPDAATVHRRSQGVDEPSVRRRDAGGSTEVWTVRRKPAWIDEPGAPPYGVVGPALELSTYASWKDVGAFYADLARQRYVLDEGLRAEARRRLEGAATPAEKARRLATMVRDGIRYVGIEFGVGGYQPRAASAVARSRFGDCKDQATLLIALARDAGLEAWPVLVAAGNRVGISERLPSPGAFNHAIVWLPGVDGGTFADTTSSFLEFGVLDPAVQGAGALVVRDDGVELRNLPVHPAERTLLRQERSIDLTDPARAAFVDRSVASGVVAMYSRSQYGTLNPDEATARVAADVRREFPAATSMAMDVRGSTARDADATIVQTFIVPDLLRDLGGGRWLLTLDDSDEPTEILDVGAEGERVHPYHAYFRFRSEYTSNVRLPAGWRVDASRPAVSLAAPGCVFAKRAEATPEGLKVSSRFEVPDAVVAPRDFAAFAACMKGVAKHRAWSFVLSEPSP